MNFPFKRSPGDKENRDLKRKKVSNRSVEVLYDSTKKALNTAAKHRKNLKICKRFADSSDEEEIQEIREGEAPNDEAPNDDEAGSEVGQVEEEEEFSDRQSSDKDGNLVVDENAGEIEDDDEDDQNVLDDELNKRYDFTD